MDPNQPLEFTGETVDEAIASGVEELGVAPSDVLVEVLEEPTRGIFGIGARQARVRLKLLRAPAVPDTPQPVQEQEQEPTVAEDDEDDDNDDPYAYDLPDTEIAEDSEGAIARDVLQQLLDKMDLRASIEVKQAEEASDDEQPPPWVLNVNGPDADSLVGRRGETLAALQYITRLITSRHLQSRANVIVDANGYKSRRTDRLEKLAIRMADEAIETGRTVTLEPMPANERRIIHMTLRQREDVETRSTGDGDARKVSIVPV
jgi:spoIIIJ-associated protein